MRQKFMVVWSISSIREKINENGIKLKFQGEIKYL